MVYFYCTKTVFLIKVITTKDGQQAWDNLEQLRKINRVYDSIQCIITDVEMPQMDGITLARKIKETDAYKDLPVIIFSSLVNDALRRKAQNIGIDALVSKPEINQLVQIIEKAVEK